MTDDEFLGYCELHCQTERALFSGADINRLVTLAGAQDRFRPFRESEWLSAHEDPVLELVSQARKQKTPLERPLEHYTLLLTEKELFVLSKWAVLAAETNTATEDLQPALSLSEKVTELITQVESQPK